MIPGTLYKFELKKLFFARVNMIAMAGAVIMLAVLVISSMSEAAPVSREAAKELDGRAIDEKLIEEIRPAIRNENGAVVIEITADNEKYVPVIDVITAVTGRDSDLTQLKGAEFYELRAQELERRMEEQGLTETDKKYWRDREARVTKPFVYHYHSGPSALLKSFQALGFFILLLSAAGLSGVYAGETADNMNQLLLCSRYGKKELYMIKFAAGLTWALAAAVIVLVSVMIPFCAVYGMEGMEEMLQLVKPLSMLPCSIGRMLAVYTGIYLLSAVLFASVTMLLSVVTQNSLAVTCVLMGYLLADLFADFPDKLRFPQKIWSLRPNAVLMNTGFSNYRLFRFAGRPLLNYQAAPVLYAALILAALFIGRRKYRGLQVGK